MEGDISFVTHTVMYLICSLHLTYPLLQSSGQPLCSAQQADLHECMFLIVGETTADRGEHANSLRTEPRTFFTMCCHSWLRKTLDAVVWVSNYYILRVEK